jgi:hypothetical protein
MCRQNLPLPPSTQIVNVGHARSHLVCPRPRQKGSLVGWDPALGPRGVPTQRPLGLPFDKLISPASWSQGADSTTRAAHVRSATMS